ncbi:hypothetical protein P171DRAFT_144975 [Karstenula rhodostoma CBS 690.94]|uniref:Uncharacterized protein n=1 Tax=Karstenula rhodostoma CBS 690.94 TaxID=1392251 RepID=A0A9P4PUY9_9PLEO|nr:hypothetical protein P171DRAFT_144975 [Karstenula rhodostoma CBS 690.94]
MQVGKWARAAMIQGPRCQIRSSLIIIIIIIIMVLYNSSPISFVPRIVEVSPQLHNEGKQHQQHSRISTHVAIASIE